MTLSGTELASLLVPLALATQSHPADQHCLAHFPKDPTCEVCLQAKMCRAPASREKQSVEDDKQTARVHGERIQCDFVGPTHPSINDEVHAMITHDDATTRRRLAAKDRAAAKVSSAHHRRASADVTAARVATGSDASVTAWRRGKPRDGESPQPRGPAYHHWVCAMRPCAQVRGLARCPVARGQPRESCQPRLSMPPPCTQHQRAQMPGANNGATRPCKSAVAHGAGSTAAPEPPRLRIEQRIHAERVGKRFGLVGGVLGWREKPHLTQHLCPCHFVSGRLLLLLR